MFLNADGFGLNNIRTHFNELAMFFVLKQLFMHHRNEDPLLTQMTRSSVKRKQIGMMEVLLVQSSS